jgi:hypothetical protein
MVSVLSSILVVSALYIGSTTSAIESGYTWARARGDARLWDAFIARLSPHHPTLHALSSHALLSAFIENSDLSRFDNLLEAYRCAKELGMVREWQGGEGSNFVGGPFYPLTHIAGYIVKQRELFDGEQVECAEYVLRERGVPGPAGLEPILRFMSVGSGSTDSVEQSRSLPLLTAAKLGYSVYLIRESGLFVSILKSEVEETGRAERLERARLAAPLLDYSSFRQLFSEHNNDHELLKGIYRAEIKSIFSMADTTTTTSTSDTTTNKVDLSNVSQDILVLIICRVDLFTLTYIIPTVNRHLHHLITPTFTRSMSTRLGPFIAAMAKRVDPSRLFCFHPISRLFRSVHDLVHYYILSPCTSDMDERWLMLFHEGIGEFSGQPPQLLKQSLLLHLRVNKKIVFDDHVCVDALARLVDIAVTETALTRFLVSALRWDYKRYVYLVKTCNCGLLLLQSVRQFAPEIWARVVGTLLIVEPNPSPQLQSYLHELYFKNTRVQIPLTARDICDHLDKLDWTDDEVQGVEVVARILVAFAEVTCQSGGECGVPKRLVDMVASIGVDELWHFFTDRPGSSITAPQLASIRVLLANSAAVVIA